ncbi:TPA: hypothetical protein ACNTVS_003449, partial [Escherichia coli]
KFIIVCDIPYQQPGLAGFSFALPSSHKPFKKPPQPPFSYRYAMQVTKLILFAIKHLISKHI